MSPQKKEEILKLTENTLMPISLVLILLSGSWAASKLDSRIDFEKERNDRQDKQIESMHRIEKRLYKIEIKTGVDRPEPLIEGD